VEGLVRGVFVVSGGAGREFEGRRRHCLRRAHKRELAAHELEAAGERGARRAQRVRAQVRGGGAVVRCREIGIMLGPQAVLAQERVGMLEQKTGLLGRGVWRGHQRAQVLGRRHGLVTEQVHEAGQRAHVVEVELLQGVPGGHGVFVLALQLSLFMGRN